jgi:hypothetical protein
MSSVFEVVSEVVEDFARDIAFEASEDVFLRESLGRASFGVGAGGFVPAESADRDHVQGAVGLPVAASVQS